MKSRNTILVTILNNVKNIFQDAVRTSVALFKITIPIIILTKLFNEFGLTAYIGMILSPVMELIGLPGSMGFVWATAMLTNLYGAMIVFASLAPAASLSVAQVTILTTLMLVAHSLPVELRIAQKSGPRFRAMLLLRLIGAFVLGWILHQIYTWSGSLQEPFTMLWNPPSRNVSWPMWIMGECKNVLYIFLIIIVLLLVMKFLRYIGLTQLLTRLLAPILSALGIGRNAAPITIIGMLMGITYGGGLIIQETRSGSMSNRDIFFSLTLMGLTHSLIEDTLLMMAIGGHLSGILAGRLLFSLGVTYLIVKLFRNIPEEKFNQYFFRINA